MVKSNAIVKVDTEENWKKAINYIPDSFTILIFTYENSFPKVKIGDGIHKINELPFLNHREVEEETLVL